MSRTAPSHTVPFATAGKQNLNASSSTPASAPSFHIHLHHMGDSMARRLIDGSLHQGAGNGNFMQRGRASQALKPQADAPSMVPLHHVGCGSAFGEGDAQGQWLSVPHDRHGDGLTRLRRLQEFRERLKAGEVSGVEFHHHVAFLDPRLLRG